VRADRVEAEGVMCFELCHVFISLLF